MSNPPPDDRPYSVKQLAERWGCTRHVHKIIRRSELRAFKVGDKLLRVAADEVRRIEQQVPPKSNGN